MEVLESFASWAWARHHNVLSWYVRPLFLLPLCYFAYKRSPAGLFATVLALLSSMFWFPAPGVTDPDVASALEAERQYLLGSWPLWKIAVSLLVPCALAALVLAFWQRSWFSGAVLVNAIAVSKVTWSLVVFDRGAFGALLVPATVGLIVCNAVLWLLYRRFGLDPK